MPALANVPGVARCVVTGTANGQACVNVFHVAKGTGGASPWTQVEIDKLATLIAAQFTTAFVPSIANHWSGDQVECVDLSSVLGLSGVATIAASGGGGSGTTMPQSAAACVTWKIPRHYRGGHPRTYVGPLATAAAESPVSLAATFVSNLRTRAIAFRNNINGDTTFGTLITLCTVHRTYQKQKLNEPQLSFPTSAEVDSRIDSQRRRLGPDR